MSPLFKEAKRLYQQGFAIHWLKAKSKMPVESGWTTGPRKDWGYLKETYHDGLNLGVRLGTPSKIRNHYLAVVDVDVKSSEKRHRVEALGRAKELLCGLAGECPVVVSGRGNGSRHFYCLTEKPFKTWNPFQSDEMVKVRMPSKKPSKKELAELSEKEIAEGWRISHAWEISLYSEGRQVVLPPSIHPDTGASYSWLRSFTSVDTLPVVPFPLESPAAAPSGETSKSLKPAPQVLDDIKFPKVDLGWLPIPDEVRDAIQHGVGVEDRSGYLLRATTALHSAGLSRDEILSVLTDKNTFLGACAYEHAGNTGSRKKAANWLWKFTVAKVLGEREANVSAFATPIVESRKLTPEEVKTQEQELVDWRKDLVRTGPKGDGPPRSTVGNVVLILTHAVAPDVVRRDEFAFRDAYGCDTPWGGKKDAVITDDDVAKIKLWLGDRFRFEPSDKVIFDALINLACENAYDPVLDMLGALPEWDGVSRLDTWLVKHFGATGDKDYLAQVFRKWLVGMIARAKRPGVKFDWMPIFEGPQGAGKSSFGQILVGEKYFLDWLPNLADKDSALSLQGMWAVEMGELANMRRTELETVKAYITRTVDKVRPPFGKRWLESPRRVVFFGTTNRSTYLTDDTGNRRFKPLMVGKLDFEQLRADREQLLAEALAIYTNLESKGPFNRYFDLTGNALIFEAKIHREKMVEDESNVMFEAMQDFIKKVERGGAEFDFKRFRMLELFQGVGPLNKTPATQRNLMFAGKMLKRFGGEKRSIKGLSYWKIDEGDTSDDAGSTPVFF